MCSGEAKLMMMREKLLFILLSRFAAILFLLNNFYDRKVMCRAKTLHMFF